jgi:translocation and assembly module TamB
MRRSLKIIVWVLGSTALLLALLIGSVLILGNSRMGREQIQKLTARLTGGQVQLTGLAGSFPSHLTLAQLQLRDAGGVWLTATGIELDWTPLAYLEGRLQVDRLQVATVDMQRLPQSSATPGNGSASIPRIDVARASIGRLDLGAPLAGAPTSLVAGGSAHLRSLQDMLFDASARRIGGDGEYELHLHFDDRRMDGSLKLHEPAGGPLENILSLPGLGALQAAVNLSGPRSAEQLDISLQAGSLAGHAQGTVNLNELSADLAFSFESGAMNPRPDIGWERAVLNGRWHGNVKSPNAEGHLALTRLRAPGTQVAALTADLAANLGNAELHALARGVTIPGSQPRLLESDPLKIDASVRLDDPARRLDVAVSHRLFSLRGQAVTAGDQSATVDLQLPNLTPFAGYAAQELRGSAVIHAQLSGYPSATRIQLDASGALLPGPQIWARAIGDRARLEFSGSFKDAALNIDSLKFSGNTLALGANGTVSARSIKGRWDLALSDLKVLSPVLGGTLKGSGSVDGPPNALAVEATLSSMLSVRGSPGGVLTAEVKVRGLPATPAGTLTAQGSLDGAPLNLDASMERGADRAFHAVVHRASWRSLHMDGDITLARDMTQMHGQLDLAVAQLQDLQHLLGVELAGSLAGNLVLRPDGARTRAHVQVDAQDVRVAGIAGTAHVSGDGFTDAFAFKAGVQIPKLKGAAASLDTSGNLNLDSSEVSLASALGNYRGQEFHLIEPARIHFGDGLSVDRLKVGSQKAELDLQGQVTPTLGLRGSLRNVQPALINVFLPNLLAQGVIDAQADLHGSLAQPVGEITVHAVGIESADDAALGLPPANIRLTAGLRGHTADIDARLDAGAASQLSAVGEAPLASDGEVNMKIDGKLDVGVVNPFLEARGQHASGQLDINATVTGSVAAPQIAGTLDLKNGKVNDYGRGITLSDITAQIAGNEGALQIKSFTASAPPGTVSMSGSVGILQKGIPVDLTMTARNAQPIVSKLVTSNLNADLAIKGTARERLDVSGSVHLNRTLIGIPNGMPLNVAVLDVRRRGKTTVVVPEKPLIIGLNVSVQAPQEILVQGRGLDAEMGGDLQISGTADSPVVNGAFELQRGTFSLASGTLNFSAGRVSFNGAGLRNKIDPTLDFTAQATVTDTTAILHITGLADAPQFEFTSNPAKPQDEIMALLLFGAPTQQLTPLQLAQVGAALASFSGVGGNSSLNPLVKIQRSLGLDRLNFGSGGTTSTGADTGASIAAGRYVSKRIYLEAKQSTTGASQLEADVDLTKHLKLQTRLGNGTASVQGTTPDNDPGSSVGLRYQFEY